MSYRNNKSSTCTGLGEMCHCFRRLDALDPAYVRYVSLNWVWSVREGTGKGSQRLLIVTPEMMCRGVEISRQSSLYTRCRPVYAATDHRGWLLALLLPIWWGGGGRRWFRYFPRNKKIFVFLFSPSRRKSCGITTSSLRSLFLCLFVKIPMVKTPYSLNYRQRCYVNL
jgi:hypothetical protein